MGRSENESYLDSLLKSVMEPQTVSESEVTEVVEEMLPESEVTEVVEEMLPESEVIEVVEEMLPEPEATEVPEEVVPDVEYMEMPEFVMDDDTAKEVEALLNFDFDTSSISEQKEAEDALVADEPVTDEPIADEPVIEVVSEEIDEVINEMPDFVMDSDTAKEVEALLNADFDLSASSNIETEEDPVLEAETEIPDETEIPEEIDLSEETLEIPEEIGDVPEQVDILDISEMTDVSDISEMNDDLLDEDIENLLGMETIETDDSELLGDVDKLLEADFDKEVEMIVPTIEENQFLASPSLEETQDMSQDDIEALLKSTSESSVNLTDLFGSVETTSEDDLLALLAEGTDDVADADELLALLGGADDSEELSYINFEDESAVEPTSDDKNAKKEKKSKKKRKKGKDSEIADEAGSDTTPKETVGRKPSAFRRFMDFLMEEDDEEENKAGGQGTMEMSEEQMSDLLGNVSEENKEIIKELDKEEKKKKKRKKKGKKGEPDPIDADEDEIDAKPTGKPKKQKKPKKEKNVKPEEYDPSAKKLSKKKVGITFGLIATVMVAILVVNYLYAGAQALKKARNAYYAQDYATCYETLYGKELSESDEILFNRSSLMLRMSRSVDAYEGFMAAGMPLQALDSLIQGIGRFEALRIEAALYELEREAEEIHSQLVECLGGFGLSEQKALDIYNSESDEEYTNQLIDAVENGVPLVDEEEEETEKEYLYDALPVEEEIN